MIYIIAVPNLGDQKAWLLLLIFSNQGCWGAYEPMQDPFSTFTQSKKSQCLTNIVMIGSTRLKF